jgi:hypothetical protein
MLWIRQFFAMWDYLVPFRIFSTTLPSIYLEVAPRPQSHNKKNDSRPKIPREYNAVYSWELFLFWAFIYTLPSIRITFDFAPSKPAGLGSPLIWYILELSYWITGHILLSPLGRAAARTPYPCLSRFPTSFLRGAFKMSFFYFSETLFTHLSVSWGLQKQQDHIALWRCYWL